MAGERRKRQQRVRHEAGGAAGGGVAAEPEKSSVPPPREDKPPPATSAPPPTGGGGRQPGRGGPPRPKKGVSAATIDETKYYQPVTIMEGKGDKAEELDDAPQKYKRRGIVSNWSRYEERPTFLDEVEDGADYLIGEDFANVLKLQSQSAGAHLQLKGEESWAFSDHLAGGGGVGMGALKVADLAATIATIPFTQQILMEDYKLPKQLLDYYTEIASDNRKVYNPEDEPKHLADTTHIIEQQVQNLRIAFFEGGGKTKDAKNLKNTKKQDSFEKPSKELEFYESVASTIDFDALPEETPQSDSATVDLTSKMCEAFGSKNLADDKDEFADFISPTVEENMKTENTADKIKNETETSSQRAPKEIEVPEKKAQPPPIESNTSPGTFNFGLPNLSAGDNFGLPKLSSGEASTNLNLASLHKLNKMKEEDIDVFTPVDNKPKEEIKKNEPVIDLNAPIIPKATAPVVQTKETTQELEDWLDSVLDD